MSVHIEVRQPRRMADHLRVVKARLETAVTMTNLVIAKRYASTAGNNVSIPEETARALVALWKLETAARRKRLEPFV